MTYRCPKCENGIGDVIVNRTTWLFRFICLTGFIKGVSYHYEGPETKPNTIDLVIDAKDKAHKAAIDECKALST